MQYIVAVAMGAVGICTMLAQIPHDLLQATGTVLAIFVAWIASNVYSSWTAAKRGAEKSIGPARRELSVMERRLGEALVRISGLEGRVDELLSERDYLRSLYDGAKAEAQEARDRTKQVLTENGQLRSDIEDNHRQLTELKTQLSQIQLGHSTD